MNLSVPLSGQYLFMVYLMIQELTEILRKGESRRIEFNKFCARLAKRKIPRFDRTIQEIHDEVFSKIDCTKCANCCRVLGPRLNTTDIDRFAGLLGIRLAAFVKNYLRCDEDGDLVFREMPCPFIGGDNLCTEYDARPRACRRYPHTDEKRMQGKLSLLAVNSRYCPAAVRIIEILMERYGF
jgi:Fe-S-cluster containining protein